MKPLVLAQSPLLGREALPAVVGTGLGLRLAEVCGLASDEELLDHFSLQNLCSTHVARFRSKDPLVQENGRQMAAAIERAGVEHVICLGVPVYGAIVQAKVDVRLFAPIVNGPRTWYVAPPVSRRNRYWTDPDRVRRAEKWWRRWIERDPEPPDPT